MNTHASLFNLGSQLVLANRGISREKFNHDQGLVERLRSVDAEPFHREVCKIAAAAYEQDGLGNSVQWHLFTKLASAPQWHESYARFTMPVLSALGRFAERELELHKKANAIAALPLVADKVGIPSALKLLLGLGTVGGIGAGSLGFLLSRDARESSAENNALTEKARAYKQLRRDIEEDLAASGALEEDQTKKKRYAL